MSEAGCDAIEVGFESISKEILNIIGNVVFKPKYMTPDYLESRDYLLAGEVHSAP